MSRPQISYVPVILAVVGILAGAALVSDHNVRTWAVVMSCTTLAAVGYGAYQEHRAHRAVRIARTRVGTVPYDEVRREMDRARRHERPFALAQINLESTTEGKAGSARTMHDLTSTSRRPMWRSTDRFWRVGRSLYLLMPETTAAAAREMVRRALRHRPDVLDAATVVAFPEDGVTAGALFARLGAALPSEDDVRTPDTEGEGLAEPEMERIPVVHERQRSRSE